MQAYELTLVLSGKATAAKIKKMQAFIEKLVKVAEGKVKKMENWGKIELAYPIAKNESGFFLHYVLELKRENFKLVHEKVNLEAEILRYLLVKPEKNLRIKKQK